MVWLMWCIIIHICYIIILFTSRVHIFIMCRERSRGDWIWLHLHAGQEEWTKRDNFKLQLRGRQPSWTEFYTILILLPRNHDWYKGILPCLLVQQHCRDEKSYLAFPVDTIMSTFQVPVLPLPYVYMYTNVHVCAYILYYTCTVVGGNYIVSAKNNVCPSWGQIISGIIRDDWCALFRMIKKITELYLHHLLSLYVVSRRAWDVSSSAYYAFKS